MPVQTLRATHDFYDPDDVGLRDSPPPKPMKYNLSPSPSPPPDVPLPPVSPGSTPGPPDRKPSARSKTRPSEADGVLIAHMGGGNNHDVAREAARKPLASEIEEELPSKDSINMVIASGHKEDKTVTVVQECMAQKDAMEIDMAALISTAADALRQSAKGTAEAQRVMLPRSLAVKQESSSPEPRNIDETKSPVIPSLNTLYVDGPPTHLSPERTQDSVPSPAESLPPILHHSPQSGVTHGIGAIQITLPSISSQLGDFNQLEAAATSESAFSQSPPGRPPPRFSSVPSHGSPPKSPIDYRRVELPSPGRNHFYPAYANGHRASQSNGEYQYQSPGDYSGSSTETPSTDATGATPAARAHDLMSIDGITNPQIGGFQCTYTGCTAQPFQTQVSDVLANSGQVLTFNQYLLNSHANVHSQNRPHYCAVKGCPRSEGGKGFKRKNEMIRHGLVHDSPGYVCPFCPDREHKYPRPDNLQRYAVTKTQIEAYSLTLTQT